MHRLAHLVHVVQHFIYNDHKAESVVSIGSATITGVVASRQMDITHELLYRDINTAFMAVVAAVIGWYVTKFLKKISKDE